ncbi:MAG TPA: hypothetical protein VMI93_07625 [Candidatus Solibacter sp.]|nr:hypothetical protein [Candidatus Solibacter sp.]
MPKTAKTYIALIIASGAAVLLFAIQSWPSAGLRQFVIYLGLAALASTLKVRIPGMEGTISPNFIFLLLGMASCRFSEVVVISLAAALVQSLWASAKRPRLVQVAFSAATLVVSSAAAYALSHLLLAGSGGESSVPLVLLAGSVYFPLNSALVSVVIGLVSGQPLRQAAQHCYGWVFRHFMGGILFAGLISGAYSPSTEWRGALVLLPAVVLAYVYYRQRAAGTMHLDKSRVPAD